MFSCITIKFSCKNDGREGSRGCMQVASVDSCRMRGIEADCSRLKPGAQREHLISQPSLEAAWLLVTCGSPVYLVVDELRPCVLSHLMIVLDGSVVAFWHGEYGFTYRELMLSWELIIDTQSFRMLVGTKLNNVSRNWTRRKLSVTIKLLRL